MVTHNHLLRAGEGLEHAFELAEGMRIDYVRTDLEWRNLDTDRSGRWLWKVDDGHPNHWRDSVRPALACTRAHGMRTLVVVKVSTCPGYRHQRYQDSFKAWWDGNRERIPWWRRRPRLDDARHAALWAAWAEGKGVLGDDGPMAFLRALIEELGEGVARGDYDIVGFNVENEPNVDNMPNQDAFKRLRIPEGAGTPALTTYTTADLIKDALRLVKEECATRPGLAGALTVVNLHSYDRHWDHPTWRAVGFGNPYLDVLGIDIYPTHIWTGTRADKRDMHRLSAEYGKPWWVVEMEGAPSPRFWPWQRVHSGRPDVDTCRRWAQECADLGAEVVGFYRLWGTYKRKWASHDSAYNIYQNPGEDATETVVKGKSYPAMIRDLFEE
jgi:hypothetical protein